MIQFSNLQSIEIVYEYTKQWMWRILNLYDKVIWSCQIEFLRAKFVCCNLLSFQIMKQCVKSTNNENNFLESFKEKPENQLLRGNKQWEFQWN